MEEKKGQAGVPDQARRRLLKTAAYAAPFVLTLGLPRTGSTASCQRCNGGPHGRHKRGNHRIQPD